MKKLFVFALVLFVLAALVSPAFAAIKRIKGYTRSNGTYVRSHYRDTSNDGRRYNNANYLGYND
jgi:hypothetical protein